MCSGIAPCLAAFVRRATLFHPGSTPAQCVEALKVHFSGKAEKFNRDDRMCS